jgi:hypothetical protein
MIPSRRDNSVLGTIIKIMLTVFEKLPCPSIRVIPYPRVESRVMMGWGSAGVISRTMTYPMEIMFSICIPNRVPMPYPARYAKRFQ